MCVGQCHVCAGAQTPLILSLYLSCPVLRELLGLPASPRLILGLGADNECRSAERASSRKDTMRLGVLASHTHHELKATLVHGTAANASQLHAALAAAKHAVDC